MKHKPPLPAAGAPDTGASGHHPPRKANALLHRWLPPGILGLSIIGDLHQEYNELIDHRSAAAANRWYWRAATMLSLRYATIRLKNQLLDRQSGDPKGVEMMTTLLADIRFGYRMLLKTPMLSIVAMITIALGVGLTTYSFSSTYGTIVRGLPVPGAERLMFVAQDRLELSQTGMRLSMTEYEDLSQRQTVFEGIGTFYQGTINLGGEGIPPERYAGAFVSATALSELGVPPLLGRTFREGEDALGASPVIVLGYSVWQNRFAGNVDILGQRVRMNGVTAEIVGVMPEGFAFPFDERLWTPHRVDVPALAWGEGQSVSIFARLKENISIQAARTELDLIAVNQARTHPEDNEGVSLTVKPFEEMYMPGEIRAVLWTMLVGTLGVLLIACVNVANLLLARAALRSKEMAVRTALGASRFRVIRQMLIESLLLSSIGGLLGLGIAYGGISAYRTVIAGIQKPYWIDMRLDLPVLVFSLGITCLAAVAAGILPAVRASGVKIASVLKDESRGSSSRSLGRFSYALVVAEIAVSAALLVSAGFAVKSIVNLRNQDLGFETAGVLTGQVSLFETDYPTQESRTQFFSNLKQRLGEIPGVEVASLGTHLPGLGTSRYYLGIGGATYAQDGDHPIANVSAITEDYFATFRVEFLQGRDFSRLDRAEEGERVAIVSQSFADRHFPTESAIGGSVRLGISTSSRPWRTIIGVVPDMHVGGGTGGIGDDRISPERVFVPQGALGAGFASFAIRTQGAPEEMALVVRNIVSELDPNLPVYNMATLATNIKDATWAFDLFGGIFSIVGMVAVFLAAVGLYGVIAFSVAQRRQEMGVRMALGAGTRDILRLVLRKGTVQLGLGIMIGLLLGAGMSRTLQVILYGVEVGDPLIYLSTGVTLAIAGFMACLIPARSASKTDPLAAMRTQ